uniref:Uncharacterized protein n=1 Tax=Nephromyces sp. ex Molgula occidentalis TaxID=2544991 RepID=A0A5C1H7I7_9APIC|nr:hypothetical protein [Nephromyces sp. ex Molgula occidentalis]
MNLITNILLFKYYLTNKQELKKKKKINLKTNQYNYIVKFWKYSRFLGLISFKGELIWKY